MRQNGYILLFYWRCIMEKNTYKLLLIFVLMVLATDTALPIHHRMAVRLHLLMCRY